MLVEQFVMLSAVQWESFLNDLMIAYVMHLLGFVKAGRGDAPQAKTLTGHPGVMRDGMDADGRHLMRTLSECVIRVLGHG